MAWRSKIYLLGHTFVQMRKWVYHNGLSAQDVVFASPQSIRNIRGGHHCIVLLNAYWRGDVYKAGLDVSETIAQHEMYGNVPVFKIDDDAEYIKD